MNFTIKLWSLYKSNALYRPVRTKIATAFSLFFVADIFCQFVIASHEKSSKSEANCSKKSPSNTISDNPKNLCLT